MANYRNTALVAFLREADSALAAKLEELRTAVEDWLSYVPATFPQYTRHTVRHSDEIVLRVSEFLFDDSGSPVVDLSPLEAFVVGAAAYLHDAGMVASDESKARILGSPEWKAWVGEGQPGHRRHVLVREAEEAARQESDEVKSFVADVERRRLLADFLRRTHHVRSADFAQQHQSELGRFAFDEPLLTRTIADVCAGHGLSHVELDDPIKYPFRRNILGYVVNVRFAAIVLRLGDLLDLSSERACPLVLNAANPVPPDSSAHWSQYQRITQRAISPQKIEVAAECQTQAEHRVLQDWLGWIGAEVVAARALLAGTDRHAGWTPPAATTEGTGRTLRVARAPGATYIPSRWTFQIDADAVLDRLIHDVYTSPLSFVKELLQNALDAQRCRMFAELGDRGRGIDSPSRVDQSVRMQYPVVITLEDSTRWNPLTSEDERVQVLRISDRGIGMSLAVVQDYLLQVGRSFYSTPRFREEYAFVPTSRFGVGFLSVFGASEDVTVTTKKDGSAGIKLTLTGPRSYLLTEEFDAADAGTVVEVVLRRPWAEGELTAALRSWCRYVEFPIEVNDLGRSSIIVAERPDDFEYEYPDATEEGWTLAVRSFPVSEKGLEGHLYVFVRRSPEGSESWTAWSWAQYTYPRKHPAARSPTMPESVACINGLAADVGVGSWDSGFASRLDFRKPVPDLPITREMWGLPRNSTVGRDTRRAWESVVTSHLGTVASTNWEYRNALAKNFRFLGEFWLDVPGLVPAVEAGRSVVKSIREARAADDVIVFPDPNVSGSSTGDVELAASELDRLDEVVRAMIFEGRHLVAVDFTTDGWTRAVWREEESPLLYWTNGHDRVYASPLENEDEVGLMLHKMTSIHHAYVLNTKHRLVTWLERIREAACAGIDGLRGDEWEQVIELLLPPMRQRGYLWDDFLKFLAGWADLPLPPDLKPPLDLPRSELFRGRGRPVRPA